MSSDWLFSAAELQRSPSWRDGVSPASELERRAAACRLIARLAAALRVSLASQRAACVFLHRFFMRRSLARCDERRAAAACLLLASKAENDETQGVDARRLARALIAQSPTTLSEADVTSDILQREGDVLLALSFELDVDHSFGYIAAAVDKVVALTTTQGDALRQKLKQTAWSFLNDSAITWTCLAVDAPLAAQAAVYAAGLFGGCVSADTVTSEGGPWWTVLETPVDVLKDAARHVLSAYTAPFVDSSVLPSALVELVNVFHEKTQSNESSESGVREVEVPEAPYEPLDDDFKQVDIDAAVLFQSVEGSAAGDETFVDRTTAWIEDCVVVMKGETEGEQSPSSPSDPSVVEKSIPLYSPQNRAMESCTQGPLLLKRSITLAECGRRIKKAKLAL
ncbi:Cyclin- protein fam58a [Phytophthora pseudosyringae]|uniref:Cyclin- protein fam58a n=1 Tax=Phytophthora pseudosyringae TaxID=221518 RepID=A0A8T1VMA5_9STRA|nr:Cyclin- protein fam58a [Phytophthora pseudosyringae]